MSVVESRMAVYALQDPNPTPYRARYSVVSGPPTRESYPSTQATTASRKASASRLHPGAFWPRH